MGQLSTATTLDTNFGEWSARVKAVFAPLYQSISIETQYTNPQLGSLH